MGSNRSRKLKARENYQFGNLDDVFARIKDEREGRPFRETKPEQPKLTAKPKNKEERENPNHPCYKCIGCAHWTKCVGYTQLLICMRQRREAYERKIAENE